MILVLLVCMSVFKVYALILSVVVIKAYILQTLPGFLTLIEQIISRFLFLLGLPFLHSTDIY